MILLVEGQTEEVILKVSVAPLLLVLSLALSVEAGLLGAGYGHGSCRAAPFRSDDLDHVGGCPRHAECCTEYGYCHPRVGSDLHSTEQY